MIPLTFGWLSSNYISKQAHWMIIQILLSNLVWLSPNFHISKFLIFYLLQQLLLNHLRFQYYCTRLHLLPSLHELDSLILHFNDLLIHLIFDINHLFFAKFSLNHLSCLSQISNSNYLSVNFYRSKDCQQLINMVKKQAPNKDHLLMLDVLG